MPTPLIEATYDFRIKKSIDEATYDQRIGISFVQKSVPTRTVTCQCAVRPSDDLPPSLVRYAIQWAMLLGAPASSSYPLTLKRSAPTSPRYPSPPTASAKYRQDLHYGSPEWHAMYSTARNTIEGFNGYVKDANHEALDQPGRRRARA